MPTAPTQYVEHLLELLRPFGGVTAKSMFGGWGLYKEGLFFALVAEDQVYFKADDTNRAEFQRRRLKPFVYDKTSATMSYFAPPENALDDSVEMAKWARLGFAAAQRKARGPKPNRAAPATSRASRSRAQN